MLFCHFLYTFSEKKKCSRILIVWNLGAGYMGVHGTVFSTCLYILPLHDETRCVCWEEGISEGLIWLVI